MDDDDKVRRNLVVTSAAVVLFFWLDIPQGAILKRIFGEDIHTAISPWKVWSAVVVFVAYQLYRYWCATPDAPLFKEAKKVFLAHRQTCVQGYVQVSLDMAIEKRSLVGTLFADGVKVLSETTVLESQANKIEDVNWDRIEKIRDYRMRSEHPWSGAAFAYYTSRNHGQQRVRLDFRITTYEQWRPELDAMVLMLRSRFAPELVFPVVIGYFALILSIAALTGSL